MRRAKCGFSDERDERLQEGELIASRKVYSRR